MSRSGLLGAIASGAVRYDGISRPAMPIGPVPFPVPVRNAEIRNNALSRKPVRAKGTAFSIPQAYTSLTVTVARSEVIGRLTRQPRVDRRTLVAYTTTPDTRLDSGLALHALCFCSPEKQAGLSVFPNAPQGSVWTNMAGLTFEEYIRSRFIGVIHAPTSDPLSPQTTGFLNDENVLKTRGIVNLWHTGTRKFEFGDLVAYFLADAIADPGGGDGQINGLEIDGHSKTHIIARLEPIRQGALCGIDHVYTVLSAAVDAGGDPFQNRNVRALMRDHQHTPLGALLELYQLQWNGANDAGQAQNHWLRADLARINQFMQEWRGEAGEQPVEAAFAGIRNGRVAAAGIPIHNIAAGRQQHLQRLTDHNNGVAPLEERDLLISRAVVRAARDLEELVSQFGLELDTVQGNVKRSAENAFDARLQELLVESGVTRDQNLDAVRQLSARRRETLIAHIEEHVARNNGQDAQLALIRRRVAQQMQRSFPGGPLSGNDIVRDAKERNRIIQEATSGTGGTGGTDDSVPPVDSGTRTPRRAMPPADDGGPTPRAPSRAQSPPPRRDPSRAPSPSPWGLQAAEPFDRRGEEDEPQEGPVSGAPNDSGEADRSNGGWGSGGQPTEPLPHYPWNHFGPIHAKLIEQYYDFIRTHIIGTCTRGGQRGDLLEVCLR